MNSFRKIPNRSDFYQSALLEISYPHELLDIFSDTDSIYKKLNPFSYNDDIAELEEQLKKELWRIVEDNLTDRQKEVVKLYASGKTQIEIAKILGVNQSSITKCLAADTMLHFVNDKISIYNVWKTWQHDSASIKSKQILSLNEDTLQIIRTSVKEVSQNEVKELLSVTTTSGQYIRATADHKFFTPQGWVELQDIIDNNIQLTICDNNVIRYEDIVSYKVDGCEVTYDIEVVGPYHNFVANNILVENCIHGNVDYKNKDKKGLPITYGGVRLKLTKIAKDDAVVNEILQKIADLRDGDPF